MQSRRLCRARDETSRQLLWPFPNRGDLQDRTALVILISDVFLAPVSGLDKAFPRENWIEEKEGGGGGVDGGHGKVRLDAVIF